MLQSSMPFKSKAQAGWMFSQKPRLAKRWAAHTVDISSLPKHVKVKESLNHCITVIQAVCLTEAPGRAVALKRLDRLPSKGPDTEHPLKAADNPDIHKEIYDKAGGFRAFWDRADTSPMLRIKHSAMQSGQPAVDKKRVAAQIQIQTDTDEKARPTAVKHNGIIYALDGHHRITARSLAGKRSTRARFVDLDKDTKDTK